MVGTFLLGATLLAASPDRSAPVPSPAKIPEATRKAYEEAAAKVGRDSDARVKLALWCQANGLNAEAVKQLALAVLNDPKNAAARGLMGLVDFRGRWERPEAVPDKVKADEALAAKLAEYNARRQDLPETPDAHSKLASWCEANGLAAEAKAHLATVVRLDPSREGAWKKLGMKKVGGRWVSTEQLAKEKADAEAQKRADKHWKPVLAKYRVALRGKDTTAEAKAATEAELEAITDPLVVPSVWAVFALGDELDQATAVRILGHVDGPAANRALAALGVFSESPQVRRTATETLVRRDGRDYIGLLIGLIRAPIRYEVRQVNGPDLPGELFVEGERAILRRVYLTQNSVARVLSQIPPRLFDSSVPFSPNMPVAMGMVGSLETTNLRALQARAAVTKQPIDLTDVAVQRDTDIARRLLNIQAAANEGQQRLVNDVAAIEATNAETGRRNERALAVLQPVTGSNLGEKPEEWKSWWADQQGYVYQRTSTEEPKPIVTQVFESTILAPPVHTACFAAGTPVLTREGLRPIETIQVGDQVLAQDTKTGRLTYTPVTVVLHNKPAPTFRLRAGSDTVVATGIHRFWKAGQGWAMARDLKPGDVLRGVGGVAKVESLEAVGVQPVFNLEVAEGQTYFVGDRGLLVHDNSPVNPSIEPFDAAPAIEGLVQADRR